MPFTVPNFSAFKHRRYFSKFVEGKSHCLVTNKLRKKDSNQDRFLLISERTNSFLEIEAYFRITKTALDLCTCKFLLRRFWSKSTYLSHSLVRCICITAYGCSLLKIVFWLAFSSFLWGSNARIIYLISQILDIGCLFHLLLRWNVLQKLFAVKINSEWEMNLNAFRKFMQNLALESATQG